MSFVRTVLDDEVDVHWRTGKNLRFSFQDTTRRRQGNNKAVDLGTWPQQRDPRAGCPWVSSGLLQERTALTATVWPPEIPLLGLSKYAFGSFEFAETTEA